jgi:hypothetical protein
LGSIRDSAGQVLEDLADFKAAKSSRSTPSAAYETATKEMQARLDQAKERYGQEAETEIIDTANSIFATVSGAT